LDVERPIWGLRAWAVYLDTPFRRSQGDRIRRAEPRQRGKAVAAVVVCDGVWRM